MKIAEIFLGAQGEIDVGVPSIFIRFSGCNLIESNNACKFCDTLWAEKGRETRLLDVIHKVRKYNCKNIVITGGEPLLHAEDLLLLVKNLHGEGYNITLETNGTIYDYRIFSYVNKISCSPKKQCLKLDVLKRLNNLPNKNVRFKFVYEDKKDKWWEGIVKSLTIPTFKVWIMPQGKTREEQLDKMQEVVEYSIRKGYNASPRLHVLIYNNRRGV